MENEISVVVKVGETSKVKLRNAKAYRALTFVSAEKQVNSKEANILIIEDLDDSELNQAEKLAWKIKGTGKHVILFSDSPSDNLTTLAINLKSNIVSELDTLQSVVSQLSGINVSTRWETRKKAIEAIEAVEKKEEIAGEQLEALRADLAQSLDRVSLLLEVKESLEDKLRIQEEYIKGIEQSGEILEDPISKEEFESMQTQVQLYLKDIEVYKENIEEQKKQIEELTLKLTEAQSIIEEYKKKIEDANYKLEELSKSNNSSIAELKEQITKLSKEAADHQNDAFTASSNLLKLMDESVQDKKTIQSLTERIKNAEGTAAVDQSEVEILRKQIQNLNDMIHTMTAEKSLADSNVTDYRDQLGIEKKANQLYKKILGIINVKIREFEGEIEAKSEGLKNAEAEIEKLTILLGSSAEEIQQLKDLQSGVSNEQSNKLITLNSQISEMQFKIDTLTSQLSSASATIVELRRDLDKAKADKEWALAASAATTTNTSKLLGDSKTLSEINTQLLDKSKLQSAEIAKLRDTETKLTKYVKELKEANSALQSKINTASRTAIASDGKITLNVAHIKSKGSIIGVYGSGSYGITTMAISLAKRLSGKVLVMDMDITNPKMDYMLEISAISSELTQISTPVLRTSFSAFLELGYDFTVSHLSAFFKPAIKTKKIDMDYFSGCYIKPTANQLTMAEFRELFTYVSNEYRYIVVDAGKLGASDAGDAIIKMITDVAFKNVIVSKRDAADTRNMSVKHSLANINTSKSVWALNLAQDSRQDDRIAKAVGGIKSVVIPIDTKFYGANKTFDSAAMLRDKVDEIIEQMQL